MPEIKFSYPEIKHVLHKIGRHSSRVFIVLDLKQAFHYINLTEESKQYTSCCASPGSPTYQYNKLSQGLNVSPVYLTSLMNDLLHELPADICEYIDCIMDDVIIFTPDIKTHKKVLKSFMLMLKKYGMLLTIDKIHTFRSKVKYMDLLLSSKDNLPTITPLGSCVKAISTLPIPITARGIKSFIGCVIYLAQFLPKLSELIKPINDILKKYNKVTSADKISPLPTYANGKDKCRKHSPDIQKYWMPNFEDIKALIVHAPVLHLPARSGRFYLECDSSAKHVGSVLYQIQNDTKHVIAFYSTTMTDAACRYSSSELELCGLKKSLLHFQYLLKYSTFTVLMDHNALKCIYCSRKPTKTVRIQKFLKKISYFSFDFQHISGKHMFVSDFLSHFSSDNIDDEPIPYLTDTSLLHNALYMSQLDAICQFNYDTYQGICTSHSFPVTRSQAKLQKIVIPSLLKTDTASKGPSAKASILQDPPAVMARKRSTALPPLDVSQSAPEKSRRGRPPTKRAIVPIAHIQELNKVVADDHN